jgi:hypothetical protein
MIAIWMLAGIIIIYLPVNLQRRLISGLYIPIAILAVFTWQQMKKSSLKTLSLLLIMLFSLPTNLLILSETVQAAGEKDSAIYVFGDELAAFRWLNENAPDDSLVMAAPDTGLLIPAYTSSRVLYGHPFETVAAEARITEVRSFYSGAMGAEAARNLLASEGVDYVLYGPREKVLGPLLMLNDWQIVFEQGEVQILARIK